MDERLAKSLQALLIAARGVEGEWWVIGSAAVALCGADLSPEDVDVFGAPEVVRGLLAAWGETEIAPDQNERFRSLPYQRVRVEGGLPIEVMGGTEVCADGVWSPLVAETRRLVATPWGDVVVPDVREQVAILRLFGREKDLAKAGLLGTLLLWDAPKAP